MTKYNHTLDIPNTYELLQVFPEAKKIAEQNLRKYKTILKEIHREEKEIKDRVFNYLGPDPKLEVTQELAIAVHINFQKKTFLEDRIKELNNILSASNFKSGSNVIADIKKIPIESLIEFNRSGFAPCVFHNEKTPSMKYYRDDNRVYCFGCGKGGDILDVYQALHNISDVKEAIKKMRHENK